MHRAHEPHEGCSRIGKLSIAGDADPGGGILRGRPHLLPDSFSRSELPMSANPTSTVSLPDTAPREAARGDGQAGAGGGPSPLLVALGALAAACFFWLHWDFLYRTWRIGTTDPNWSHVLVVPLFSAYYLKQHWAELRATPNTLSVWGLPLLALGLCNYVWWIYPGRNDMFRGLSMVVTLLGVALLLCGWRRFRILAFPILFLVFAVKIPDSIWQQIAFKLQMIAAVGAEHTLGIAGEIFDFYIEKDQQAFTMRWIAGGVAHEETMQIAEACSGLRMLMAFCALSVAMAFVHPRPWWQKVVIIGSAVPIAIGINIARVTALGLLNLVDPELAQGDFHILVGMMMLVPAALIFIGLGWIMDRIFIEDDSGDEAGHAPGPAAAARDATPSGPVRLGRLLAFGAAGLAFTAAVAGLYALGFLNTSPIQITDRLPDVPLAPLLPAAAFVMLAAALTFIPAARDAAARLVGAASLRRGLAFVAGVMLFAAAGLSVAVAATETVLIKKPVAQRHEFIALPTELRAPGGTWEMVRQEDPLPKDIEDELGTTQYISRFYKNTDVDERDPASIAYVHVAYYTGMIDTVPHVPDRCWVASGSVPGPTDQVQLDLDRPLEGSSSGTLAGELDDDGRLAVPTALVDPVSGDASAVLPSSVVPATRFTGIDPKRDTQMTAVYFFAANGRFFATPNQVRALGFDATDNYSYYCKVEVFFPGIGDRDAVPAATEGFLAAMLPEIMACLPDWQDVTEGRWPPAD